MKVQTIKIIVLERNFVNCRSYSCWHHKKFSLINCTIEPKHSEFEKVLKYYLPKCEYVTVREPVSYDYCTQKLQLKNVLQGVDASPAIVVKTLDLGGLHLVQVVQ